jgi:hypothetical protein
MRSGRLGRMARAVRRCSAKRAISATRARWMLNSRFDVIGSAFRFGSRCCGSTSWIPEPTTPSPPGARGSLRAPRRLPRSSGAVSVRARGEPARRRIRSRRTSAPSPDRFRFRCRCAGSPARGRSPGPRFRGRAARWRPQPPLVSTAVHARRLPFCGDVIGFQRIPWSRLAPCRANRHSGVGLPPTCSLRAEARARAPAQGVPVRGPQG